MNLPTLPSLDILVVDDEEANRLFLSKALGRRGHRIALAGNGAEALLRFEEAPPDLILLDVMMPGWDGYETARRLRASPAARNRWTPLIFVSALGDGADIARGLDAGGDGYLAKPIDLNVLEAQIAAMQRIAAVQRQLAESNRLLARQQRALQPPPTTAPSTPAAEASSRRERVLALLADALTRTVAGQPAAEVHAWLLDELRFLTGAGVAFIYDLQSADTPAVVAPGSMVDQPGGPALREELLAAAAAIGRGDAPAFTNAIPGAAWARNLVAVPLRCNGIAIGCIGLGQRDRPFDARDTAELHPLVDGGGSLLAGLHANTERDRIAQALIIARDKAENASRAKSDFLSRMSHELRTPLNAILGFSQLLATDPADPPTENQRESIDQILGAGRHLLDLINEVLDLSRIEAGGVRLALAQVSLAPLIDECLLLIQPMARDRAIALHPPQPSGVAVRADRVRLRQALLNVLANAVKYNRPAGEIHLGLIEQNAEIGIMVTDTGRGIGEAEQARVFEPFARLDGGEHVEGTGIGLTITRHLMELMDGRIDLVSAPGHGSSFTLWLKRSAGDAEHAATIAPAPSRLADNAPRRRALYIEDNAANRLLVAKALSRTPNWTLTLAVNGADGIDSALRERPDLILLDINLPDMSGFEVLDRLRRLPAMDRVPVVAVSADALPDDVTRGLSAGFADYLTKPLALDELAAVFDRLLPERAPPPATPR